MTTSAPARPSPPAPCKRSQRVPSTAPWAACGAIVVATLLASEATALELLLFACFELAFALVPGMLVHLLLLGRPRLAADALALALAFGLALQIAFFTLSAALGERRLFYAYPALLLGAAAPLLHRRRAALLRRSPPAPPTARPELRQALVAVAIALTAAFVVYVAMFAVSPLPRGVASASYYPDLIFNVSIAGEILHHWPFMNPSVSGVALHYHVFVNIADAAAARVTKLELATVVMRLQPALLLTAIALELFALGRRLGGSSAAGLTAVALGLLAGEPNLGRVALAGGGLPVLGFLFSPSYQLGAVFFLAVLIVLVDGLAPQPRGAPAGRALALAVLSFGAVGAKVSAVPVLAAGLALFVLGHARARGGVRAALIANRVSLAVLAAIGAGGYALIYRGGGEGLTLKPLNFLAYTAFAPVYERAGHSLAYALLCVPAGAIALGVLLAPLIGALFVADRWLAPRAASCTPERLLMCMLAASLPPFALIAVPGDSQVYFVVYGFLAAGAVSTAGLTRAAAALARSLRRGARRELPALAALALVGLAIACELFELGEPTVARWLHGRRAYAASGTSSHRGLTSGLLAGLLWLRERSRPSDVIAVNNHGLGGNGGSRYLYYSAFAERRVLIESWQYTPQAARYLAHGNAATPFPRLLSLNDAAVLAASPAAIALLRDRYGVRYIVVDRRHGPASPALGRVARLVYSNPDVAVFATGQAAARPNA